VGRRAGREDAPVTQASDGPAAGDAEVVGDPARHVAAGGWRRALVGLVLGILAGAAIGLLVPRDEERRRGAVVPTRTT
jgi:hypothetical protein